MIDLKTGVHQGAVKGLQVNPISPNLLASGSINADVLLWDLNSLQSYPPTGSKSARLEDITDLAWNCQVSHILATSSSNGYIVIWDLKSRKEVIQLCLPGGRKSVSAIAWNPDTPTHILTATDDDQSPIIYSWDLRNSHAPSMTMTGHTKGILSMSWCPKDSELLLSSGKDNRTLCWNPKNGQLVSEVNRASNWIFDTQWCPRNPDIFSSASFDGKISVNSFQALSSGHPTQTPAGPVDVFSGQPAPQPAVEAKSRQIPKWLRRPIGASFGFGGRLVTFSESSGRRLTISTLASKDKSKYAEQALKLDEALRQNALGAFCATKLSHQISNLHEEDPEAVFWSVVKALVESGGDHQQSLLGLLGFDREKFQQQVKALNLKDDGEDLSLQRLNLNEVKETSSSPIDFGASGDGDNVFDQLQSTPIEESPLSVSAKPFALFGSDSSPIDKAITQAIILGDFSTAVDICIKSDRLSDALLVAICGGPELITKTQEVYFKKVQYPYLRVVSAIIKKDLTDVVQNADVSNWEETLGLMCSFAPKEDFGRLCALLAGRLAERGSAYGLPAVICFMAAGQAADAARLLLRLESAPSKYSYVQYASWLEGLVEKLRGLELASSSTSDLSLSVPDVGSRFLEYAVLMANQGCLDIASRYYSASDASPAASLFGDRLYAAAKGLNPSMAKTEAPFEPVQVVPEGYHAVAPTPTTATYQQPQQQPWTASMAQVAQPVAPLTQPFAPVTQPAAHVQSGFGGWNPPAAPVAPMAPITPAAPIAPIAPSVPAPSPFAGASQYTQPPPQQHHQFGQPQQQQQFGQPAPQLQQQPQQPQQQYGQPSPFAPQPMHMQSSPTAMSGLPGQLSYGQPAPQQQPQQFGLPRVPSIPGPTSPTAFIPTPAISSPSLIQAPSLEQVRAPRGGFNDAPMISPKQPLAPAHPIATPTFTPAAVPAPYSTAQSVQPPSALNAMPPHHMMQQSLQQQQPQSTMAPPSTSGPTSPRLSLGPIDPSTIPVNSEPIYQSFNSLISFCQQRAMPVQRRILDDSVKRLQHLFHQLAGTTQPPLSPHVHTELARMAQLLSQRQYDAALELHVPLMTTHFTEVGQWILAVKRLIEVAKTCPPQ